jgi:response regulator RpfG family c-di-GMP phosphodiesterase
MIDNDVRSKTRVLLVEDDPGQARLLRVNLSTATGDRLEVRHVERLCEAFGQLDRSAFDIVLLDLSLPDARGLDTLSRVREHAPNLPIVVLTGLDDDEVALRAVKAGAQDYLVKGQAGGALLVRAVRYAIERKRVEEALRRAQEDLEDRVRQRTAELEVANQALMIQVAERTQAERQILQLNEKLTRRLQRIAALRQIDTAITESLDLRLTFEVILNQVTAQLNVDAAAILLGDRQSYTLKYTAGTGFRTDGIARSRIRLGECSAGRAALKRQVVSIPDLNGSLVQFVRAPLLAGEQFVAYYAVPLITKGQVQGVLEIFHRAPLSPDSEWREFLDVLAAQTAVAIDNARLFDEFQRSLAEVTAAHDATVEVFANALDRRDRESKEHSQRVAEMSVRIGRAMGMNESDLVQVRYGALLHDIGMMAVPDEILHKSRPLSEEEWTVLRRHPSDALEWLSPIASFKSALDIPYCHHEKWDGSGYPRGINGEQIPLSARIFAVAEVWDDLRSDRPDRRAWPEWKVRDHIGSLAGSHFDPKVVEVMLSLLSDPDGSESTAL